MRAYQNGDFDKLMELNPSSVKIESDIDADSIFVNEKGGVFSLNAGKSLLEAALKANDKFIAVKVAKTENGGAESFMDFSKMVS